MATRFRTLRYETCESRQLLAVNLVADVATEPVAQLRLELIGSSDGAFYSLYDHDGVRLFQTDGSIDGTRLVAESDTPELRPQIPVADPPAITELETPIGKFFTSARVELRDDGGTINHQGLSFTDGTEAGTHELFVSRIVRRSALAPDLEPLVFGDAVFANGRAYVTLKPSSSSISTFVESDGTVEGTREHEHGPNRFGEIFAVGNEVYSVAGRTSPDKLRKRNSVSGEFEEFFSSTGLIYQLTPVGDRVYFQGGDSVFMLLDGEVAHVAKSRDFAIISVTSDGILYRSADRSLFADTTLPHPNQTLQPFHPSDFAMLGERVYFPSELQLFSYVPNQTEPQIVFEATDEMGSVFEFNGSILFNADEQLWIVRDGQSPTSLAHITVDELTQVGGDVAVFTHGEDEYELWRTDGTVEGTRLLQEFSPEPRTRDAQIKDLTGRSNNLSKGATLIGDKAYAVLFDGLYEYDLRSGEHRRLFALHTSPGSSRPELWREVEIYSFEDKVLFFFDSQDRTLTLWSMAPDQEPIELWWGSAGGREPGPQAVYELEDTLVFTAGRGSLSATVWKTDGTWRGTRSVSASNRLNRIGILDPYVVLGSTLVHTQTGERTTSIDDWFVDHVVPWSEPVGQNEDLIFYERRGELWRTDGTKEGTIALLPRKSGVEFQSVTKLDDVFFVWQLHPNEDRTWSRRLVSTDGDERLSSSIVAEVATNRPRDELLEQTSKLALIGDQVFFLDEDNTRSNQLWVAPLQGGPATIVGIEESLRHLELLGNASGRLVFAATNSEFGRELWSTDGTSAGTQLLGDINPGRRDGFVGESLVLDERMYFTAVDQVHGNELWSTDGTADGTQLERDLWPGPIGSNPTDLVAGQNRFVFFADDGIHGRELYQFQEDSLLQSDLDGDGEIGFGDFLLLSHNFRSEDAKQEDGDLTGDGVVSFEDFLILSAEYGKQI